MPHRLTLSKMREEIRAHRISPVELVEAHLKQIARMNPKINAFVTVLEDAARDAARDCPDGPLHGIPVTIKDSFDVAGLATRCGSLLLPETPAERDATCVARLRAAGAVILGKTNCPEFLSSYETDNYITGRTNNPWDPDRTPGGSSGGESAAISSFCSAGGMGSDGGGSVRIPAHFCGIAGLKPTPGRVPATGHLPRIEHPGGLLGVAGPMARTAEDLRILFEVVAGYDPLDPFSAPVPLRRPDLTGLRIGLMERFYKVPVQPGIREAVQNAALALRSLGLAVEPFMPSGIERAPNLWWFFFGDLTAPFKRRAIEGREHEVHWTGTEFLSRSPEQEPTASQVVENLGARDAMRATLLAQMEDYPVLLLAPCGVPAFRHRERRWETPEKSIGLFEAMMPASAFNLLGLPALVIPFGTSEDGLPIGIQLVGRPYDEELLLEIAVQLENVRGPFPSPPPAG